ncbi:CehA/McbA family metallohydrolase [Desulfovibrio sp. JC022]|uniref:CehA/McbA family metallohydrolase n=1 Tax=Desulfovibrio sp. JC022 TaxID=2593642 RepID=UPI0013D3C6A4|nr:CehA/McbA family metallohydrolase [Desulfovibrio sp. JC022]NDV22740.1 hypothetical protein [Desulfovibrio sp. JC022]
MRQDLKKKHSALSVLLTAMLTLFFCATAQADVKIITGPTPIPAGECIGAEDITLRNDYLAVTFGVTTPGPWGVPSGGIIDGAVIRDGQYEMDHIALMDFIPNNWSSWPNTYQKIEVVKNTPEEGVIKVTRDWEKTTIQTVYTLKKGGHRIQAETTMVNDDSKPYDGLLSGYVLWPEGGFAMQTPGTEGMKKGDIKGKALGDWVVHYNDNWSIGLHAPYVDFINYNAKDMYTAHDLKVNGKKEFPGWLEIHADGDISPLVEFETERKGLESAVLSGKVATKDGKTMNDPVVIIEKNGKPYTWTIGNAGTYSVTLPVGKYTAYAAGKSYASSSKKKVTLKSGKQTKCNFSDMRYPGEINFTVVEKNSGMPIDARITIEEGESPLVKFLGQQTFFTELNKAGQIKLPFGPGKYVFKVASGESFLSKAEKVAATVKSGDKSNVKVEIETVTHPESKNWYSADMHHHSDLVDGVTAPEYLVRSQLAARLNFTLVSDHDLVNRHYDVLKLSKIRGFEFIPSIELSPDWSHFGAFPLEIGQELTVKPGTATVQELFADARSMGATALAANHPYIPYGYFYALDNGKVPGGFDPNFDLVELNIAGHVEKTIARMQDLWAKGAKYYLSAGTDTHDVWNEISGDIRMFAHIDGAQTPDNFVNSLLAGSAYASTGPLLFPEVMFGSTVKAVEGEKVVVNFTAQAVNGLKEVQLFSRGKVVDSVKFGDKPVTRDFSLSFKAMEDSYYSIVVVDTKDRKAWSNPVWIDVVTYGKTPETIAKMK